jgi:photosystem II stability/assembly factor-like uncharacterized protein
MASEPEGYGFIVGTVGVVLATYDGGYHWSSLPSPAQTILNDIDFCNGGLTLIASGQGGKVYVSTTGGASWNDVYIGNNGGPIPVIHVNIDDNGQNVLAISDLSGMDYSADLGASWHAPAMPAFSSNNIFYNVDNTSTAIFAVGETGTIYNSVDHGTTWHNVPNNIMASLRDICFKDDNEGIIIAQ